MARSAHKAAGPRGALFLGIQRAVTLAGLIMLSRIAIRQDLKFPGLFGELLGESLRVFSTIMNQRQRITRKNLIGDIDQMLIDLSGGPSVEFASVPQQGRAPAARTKPAGFALIAVVALLCWGTWALWYLPVILRLLG